MQNFEKEYSVEFLSQVIEYNHNKYIAFKNNFPFEINKEFEKVLQARYQKCHRIKRRFIFLLTRYKYIWFVTFTFDNHYINKTDRTKRDLMKSVLKTHDFKFILNIDYGKTTEREHYHCILATNLDMDVNQYIQSYYPCFSYSKLCKSGLSDFKRLSKYINKLTNHCLKPTTKRQRLLYNFKGYEILFPTYREQSNAFFLDYVSLLDKADITGKN